MKFNTKVDKKKGDRFVEVLPKLFIGDLKAAKDMSLLTANKISHIVNITRVDNFYPEKFKYLHYDFSDLPHINIIKKFDKFHTFLNEVLMNNKGTGVFVHCSGGISRSSSFVCSYLIKFKGMTLEQSLSFIKSKRQHLLTIPNVGYYSQLMQYERKFRKRTNSNFFVSFMITTYFYLIYIKLLIKKRKLEFKHCKRFTQSLWFSFVYFSNWLVKEMWIILIICWGKMKGICLFCCCCCGKEEILLEIETQKSEKKE